MQRITVQLSQQAFGGKIKTVFQMAATILLIFNFPWFPIYVFTQILVYIALVLTVISLIDYLIKNKKCIEGYKNNRIEH